MQGVKLFYTSVGYYVKISKPRMPNSHALTFLIQARAVCPLAIFTNMYMIAEYHNA